MQEKNFQLKFQINLKGCILFYSILAVQQAYCLMLNLFTLLCWSWS